MNKLLITILLISSQLVFAEKFENHFLSFQKPPEWKCQMIKTEWVCQHENPERQDEAIIIFAAKIRSTDDSLNSYLNHLKRGKLMTLDDGSKKVSKVLFTKTKKINAHQFVDSLHLNSEMYGYYTRYIATVKSDMGIVMTLSSLKSKYQQYEKVFDRVMNSLRVFNKRSDYPKLSKKVKKNLFSIEDSPNQESLGNIDKPGEKIKEYKSDDTDYSTWFIILVILSFIGYKIYQSKKKF